MRREVRGSRSGITPSAKITPREIAFAGRSRFLLDEARLIISLVERIDPGCDDRSRRARCRTRGVSGRVHSGCVSSRGHQLRVHVVANILGDESQVAVAENRIHAARMLCRRSRSGQTADDRRGGGGKCCRERGSGNRGDAFREGIDPHRQLVVIGGQTHCRRVRVILIARNEPYKPSVLPKLEITLERLEPSYQCIINSGISQPVTGL